VLESLRDATGETAILGKLQEDGRVLYLEVRESPNPVRYTAAPGELRDAHANSIGRAILGVMSGPAREQALERLSFAERTEKTITTKAAFEYELERSRERGWYSNFGESLPDLGAIAMPVTIGDVTYGISVAGPISRVEGNTAQIVEALSLGQRTLQS
jgi:DNA-binding IclR family transcriptional regulator